MIQNAIRDFCSWAAQWKLACFDLDFSSLPRPTATTSLYIHDIYIYDNMRITQITRVRVHVFQDVMASCSRFR